MIYKAGDKVVCINESNDERFGKVYEILDGVLQPKDEYAGPWLYLTATYDNGKHTGMRLEHMRPASKLEKALK